VIFDTSTKYTIMIAIFMSKYMKTNKLDGSPTKEFIINTITKDISIEAAIFDFIDNSINAAEKITNPKRLQGYGVWIEINKDCFVITDNCGGISKDKVFKGAFRIGSSSDYKAGYGIGLKRAFLKFGKNIIIESNREDYSCKIIVNVDEWGSNNKWEFDSTKTNYIGEEPEGFKIIINNLYNDIRNTLLKNTFINKLIKRIATRYRYKLKNNFSISINGQDIIPKFINGKIIEDSPYRIFNGISVKVKLFLNNLNKDNGWDIIINGRCIVERDKTKVTQWKRRLICKGCSYDNFVGEVLIECDNIKKLPLLSTKDGIDVDSRSYEKILNYMYEVIERHRDKFRKDEVIIQYTRPSNQIEILKEHFHGAKNAREVGEDSFDSALNRATLDYGNN